MNLISLGVAFSLLASSVGALWPSATKVYPTSIPQTTQEVKWMTIEEAVAQSQKDGKKKKKIFIGKPPLSSIRIAPQSFLS